jgi:uncharacterized membrane protein YqjE
MSTVSPSVRTMQNGRDGDRSLGELLKDLTNEIQRLLRAEVELAKLEAREEVDHVKDVAKNGAIAGVTAFFAVLLLSFAAAWGLAEVMPIGVAFLIIGVVYAVVAVITGMAARERAKRVDPTPHQTIETLQEDAQWLRTRSK